MKESRPRFCDVIRQKEFVVTVDLPLHPLTTVADIHTWTEAMAPFVDGIQVVDDRNATGHMSSLVAAAKVLEKGVDPIVQMTGRDRNNVALRADLLGAAAMDITSLLIMRGEKLTQDDSTQSGGVFDTAESRLLSMARKIGDESGLVSPPGFLIGTRVSAFAPVETWGARRINESLDAGARYLQTQPCLNESLLRKYVNKLVELRNTHRAALLVEIPLLVSSDQARSYKDKNPSVLVPGTEIQKISLADDPLSTGIERCAAMLSVTRDIPGVSGVNIRYEGPPEHVIAVLNQSLPTKRMQTHES
jgi:methylenetetrahydrofolate reductase (NADPH)